MTDVLYPELKVLGLHTVLMPSEKFYYKKRTYGCPFIIVKLYCRTFYGCWLNYIVKPLLILHYTDRKSIYLKVIVIVM